MKDHNEMRHELTGPEKWQQRWILTSSLEVIMVVPHVVVSLLSRSVFISGFVVCFVVETCFTSICYLCFLCVFIFLISLSILDSFLKLDVYVC